MSKRAKKDEYIEASDGLIARRSGAWARDKLSFIEEFLPPALQATQQKRQRYYVDLFAGPGKNVDDEGGEFEGAALRAVKLSAQADPDLGFTHAKLVNLDSPADRALRERVENHCADGKCLVPFVDIAYFNEDANDVVHAIMRQIPTAAYVFVFADIEKPNQLPFESVRALRMHGHKSVDFCMLFPGDMAIRRMLPYDATRVEPNRTALNRFLGTDRWFALWEKRKTDAQSGELLQGIMSLYMDQLRSLGWQYVVETRYVHRQGNARLYQLLLASNHPSANKFAQWSAARQRRRKRGPELFD